MALHEHSGLMYELVISRRAKRASLRVMPGRGLIVSIPHGFPRHQIERFIDKNRLWIDTSIAEVEAAIPSRFRQWPPRELELPAMQAKMLLDYADEPVATRHHENEWDDLHRLIKSGSHDKSAVAQEIALHLKALARRFLPPVLASHAHLHGFHYQRVSIRGQRSVWGSYSSSGTLSLNYKLLFLSRELVDYVLLHELAHTIHQDHSEAFWQLLCSLNVSARILDRKLAEAGSRVPPWLL